MRIRTRSISSRIAAGVTIMTFAVVSLSPAQASAWKPHTHVMTANAALVDAADGGVCLPGISSEEVPIGDTPLVGIYNRNGAWQRFNDLKNLGMYLRAGSLGPDAYPDVMWGQLATHVDKSRIAEESGTEENLVPYWAEGLIDENTIKAIMSEMGGMPKWRSIDWGHELLWQALNLHADQLRGKSREAVTNDTRLKSLYTERQASIAFALGYLMHMGGDAFGHAWLNLYAQQPFSIAAGRGTYANLDIAPALVPLLEEAKHMALESYIDSRYVPEVIDDVCTPRDPEWATESASICDTGEPVLFQLPCEYCNPLRGYPQPPDAPLVAACDHCFPDCNPWRRVCPPRLPGGLDCMKCPERTGGSVPPGASLSEPVPTPTPCEDEKDGSQCEDLYYECMEEIELACADRAEAECCEDAAQRLNLPPEAACLDEEGDGGGIRQYWEAVKKQREETRPAVREAILNELRRKNPGATDADLDAELARTMPCDCYQGRLTGWSVNNDGTYEQTHVEVDLNYDGKPDLLNECMLWNCYLSPGTSICPLNALVADLPEQEVGGRLMCESYDVEAIQANPDPLLLKTGVAVPRR
ncbi:MAG: hypothetical protein V2A73_05270, partial [Pseudomonadota bacterium]